MITVFGNLVKEKISPFQWNLAKHFFFFLIWVNSSCFSSSSPLPPSSDIYSSPIAL